MSYPCDLKRILYNEESFVYEMPSIRDKVVALYLPACVCLKAL